MTAVLAVLCGVVGLCVGSFLNVVIWRVPRGESVSRPPSHCPGCDTPISPRDNVPVLSWLLLRGKCRSCGNPISVRYPLVELATALLFAGLAIRIGPHLALIGFLYLGAIAVALALIDIDVLRLPNAIVLPSYPIALALVALGAWGDGGVHAFLRAVFGMTAYYGAFFAVSFAYPAGMGFGDVKLAGVLGVFLGYLGWGVLAIGAFGGLLLGGVAGVILVSAFKVGRKAKIPFGPFMLAGALIAVFSGAELAHSYARVTGVS